jgi:hypothetical protein
LGIVTTSSETVFARAPEVIYDFVANPTNSDDDLSGQRAHRQPARRTALKVGDTWQESGADGDRIFTWHLAIAMRPKLWMFNPAKIDAYHAAIARELDALDDGDC